MVIPFHPTAGSTKTISATTVSSNVHLVIGGAGPGPVQVRVYNAGSVVVFIRQGSDTSVAATTTADTPVAPGSVEVFTFNIPSATNDGLWVAGITASGAATLYLTVGTGI